MSTHFILDINEEDLPLYVGSAAGILLLVVILMGATTWRCTRAAVASSRSAATDKHDQGETNITIALYKAWSPGGKPCGL